MATTRDGLKADLIALGLSEAEAESEIVQREQEAQRIVTASDESDRKAAIRSARAHIFAPGLIYVRPVEQQADPEPAIIALPSNDAAPPDDTPAQATRSGRIPIRQPLRPRGSTTSSSPPVATPPPVPPEPRTMRRNVPPVLVEPAEPMPAPKSAQEARRPARSAPAPPAGVERGGRIKWPLVLIFAIPVFIGLIAFLLLYNNDSDDDAGGSAGPATTPSAVAGTLAPNLPVNPGEPVTLPSPVDAQPVALEGTGGRNTEPVTLPAAASVARLTHTGTGNFVVRISSAGRTELLVNKPGNYQGSRPVRSNDPVVFQIQASGDWTLNLEPMPNQDSPAFEGAGDATSGLFVPPEEPRAYAVNHTGAGNFAVTARCAGGDAIVANSRGNVNASPTLTLLRGPCFWDVVADGSWSIRPQ